MKVSALVLMAAGMITATVSYADTTASGNKDNKDNHSQALWLMLARRCDEPKITECADLTEEHFLMTDENGKNIYQIALQIHKDTQSIPCARMALSLQQHAEKMHKALRKEQCELNERISKLDAVMNTFEKSHK